MKKTLIITLFGAASLAALPANAQILGGGGLGGAVGGVLNGPSGAGQTVSGTLRGRGAGGVRLDRQVDRRRGRARANGSGSGEADALLGGAAEGLLGTNRADARASGRGEGQAGVGLDAFGTDQIRSTARDGMSRSRGVMGSSSGNGSASGSGTARGGLLDGFTGTAGALGRGSASASRDRSDADREESSSGGGSFLGSATGTVTGALSGVSGAGGRGSAGGAGSGSGRGTAPSGGGQFDAVAEGAADAAGNVSLEPGMMVRDTSGRAIGRVVDFQTAASGLIESVLIRVGDRVAAFPANNFTVSGQTLVSAMGRGEVRREAAEQQPPE